MIEAEAVVVIAALGTVFGVGLAYASMKFEVHVDGRVEKISELLPSTCCGTCGFPACAELAEAVVKDHTLINNCKACDEESWLGICNILGIELTKRKHEIALVACSSESADKFEYEGLRSCAAATLIMDGFKACKYACLGFGDCVLACPFGAIEKRGYNFFVDFRKCIGCGACVDACPRGLIKVVAKSAKVFVRCNSPDRGKIVASICETGDIVCKQCVKSCEKNAIKIENNLPVIDYDLCDGCGSCIEACKFGTIVPVFPSEDAVVSNSNATEKSG